MDNSKRTTTRLAIKTLTCNICKETYKYKSQLIRHKRVHSGEKPYKCEVCANSFGRKDYLSKHMVVHSDKKDFQMSCLWNIFFSKK